MELIDGLAVFPRLSRISRLGSVSQCFDEVPVDEIPVDQVRKKRGDIVQPAMLLVEVVGVLPDIEGQQGRLRPEGIEGIEGIGQRRQRSAHGELLADPFRERSLALLFYKR